ncbi:MAG: NIPSNAP family containing protein [Acidobacteria bacterium]|nr:NIPSNAP family containing protein [Acidobacteriota bacterium]
MAHWRLRAREGNIMNRREMLKMGLTSGMIGLTNKGELDMTESLTADNNHYYELRTYDLRNDLQPARTADFFEKHLVPALKRAGAAPVGVFNVVSGMRTPTLILLIDYRSLAEAQLAIEKVATDRELTAATEALESSGFPPFVRYESALFRAFDAHPRPELPPTAAGRLPRLFELRTYESRTPTSLRRKIDMFNQEEIKIFRDCGFANVFFGEMVVGPRMPNLTYLVGYDDMVSREKAWDTFRANPDWQRIKGRKEWSDAEVVSNITAAFLRPASYSLIR